MRSVALANKEYAPDGLRPQVMLKPLNGSYIQQSTYTKWLALLEGFLIYEANAFT